MNIIWGLLGKNKGDNSQIEVLCRALGQSLEVEPIFKTLTCQKRFVAPNIMRGANLSILSKDDKAKLKPEWPDVLIGSGRKSVGVARWVQKQSRGRTRLVWIGRPKAPLRWFDLVITTPQYGLPKAENVFQLPLPMVPNLPAVCEPADWAGLPQPWIGVLVGGANFPLIMDDVAIEQLADYVSAAQKKYGGTCLISTSPRTGVQAAGKLQSGVPDNRVFYHWSKDASGQGENPHQAILSCADRFIVTGDSVTMMAEACNKGKPVGIFALQRSVLWPRWGAKSGPLAWLVKQGVLAPPRDVSAIHEALSKSGVAEVLSKHKAGDMARETRYEGEHLLSEIIDRIQVNLK